MTDIQSWVKEWTLGCVNPAAGLPLGAGDISRNLGPTLLTMPVIESFQVNNTFGRPVESITLRGVGVGGVFRAYILLIHGLLSAEKRERVRWGQFRRMQNLMGFCAKS